jgi:hypothetical protein
MIKRAHRVEALRGIGIDRVAVAAESGAAPVESVLRMENLDTNLPLPSEAIQVTAASLSTPPANDRGTRGVPPAAGAMTSGHPPDRGGPCSRPSGALRSPCCE